MSKYKLAIVMRTDLDMGKGKMCVEAGHATLLAWVNQSELHSTIETRNAWYSEGQFKVILKVKDAHELMWIDELARREGLPVVQVRDFGKTQVEPNTLTCI